MDVAIDLSNINGNDFYTDFFWKLSKNISENSKIGNFAQKKIIFLSQTQVFRRHHVLQDPINFIDPKGTDVQGFTNCVEAVMGATILDESIILPACYLGGPEGVATCLAATGVVLTTTDIVSITTCYNAYKKPQTKQPPVCDGGAKSAN